MGEVESGRPPRLRTSGRLALAGLRYVTKKSGGKWGRFWIGVTACFRAVGGVCSPSPNRRRQSRALLLATTALTSALWAAGPAAATDWTGAVSSDWTNGANWSGGVAPIWGPVDIDTTSPHAPVLGGGVFPGLGTLTVGVTGKGALTVNNGQLWAYDHIFVGRDAGSSGTVSATGSNSFINNYGHLHLGLMARGLSPSAMEPSSTGHTPYWGPTVRARKGTLKLDGPGTEFYLAEPACTSARRDPARSRSPTVR